MVAYTESTHLETPPLVKTSQETIEFGNLVGHKHKECPHPIDAFANNDEPDLICGARAIGKEINRSPVQVYHLIAQGLLPVRKLSHKTMVASRRELRELGKPDSKAK